MSDLRKQWREQKAKMAKAGVKMSDIAKELDFGKLLDAYCAAEDAEDKVNGTEPKKAAKAKADRVKAAKAAYTAGSNYVGALHYVEKGYQEMKTKSPEITAKEKAVSDALTWLAFANNAIHQDTK